MTQFNSTKRNKKSQNYIKQKEPIFVERITKIFQNNRHSYFFTLKNVLIQIIGLKLV